MKIINTKLDGVLIIEPDVYGDSRGLFKETYHKQKYQEAGILEEFVQDGFSRSVKSTVRGLHAQLQHPQGKLVQATAGVVYDVAVDIRVGSPTFGQFVAIILSEDNHKQFYIPPNFAHGFAVVSDFAAFQYKCTDIYHPESEISIQWDDPTVGIPWPVSEPLLSEKDLRAGSLQFMATKGVLPKCDL
jgi:dTDP-4-dehydrorhamnose 3,5-epimerase